MISSFKIFIKPFSALSKHENVEPFILGGSNAPESGIPYQATFLTILTRYWCSGSIVNNHWVLTAAHCFDGREVGPITVMVGSNLLNSGGFFHPAQAIVVHPLYNDVTLENDVALLQTTTPFTFNARVQPIALGSNFVGGGVTATISR